MSNVQVWSSGDRRWTEQLVPDTAAATANATTARRAIGRVITGLPAA
jgi:hypothetical protein